MQTQAQRHSKNRPPVILNHVAITAYSASHDYDLYHGGSRVEEVGIRERKLFVIPVTCRVHAGRLLLSALEF